MARTKSDSRRTSNGEGTSHNENEQGCPETNHKRKNRGLSMCNTEWPLDESERIRVDFNEHGQPFGDHAATFVTASGVLARMGKYCDITKSSWRKIVDPMKGVLIDYMKERFIFPEETEAYEICERVLLQSIGKKWREHKCRLREKVIYKKLAEGVAVEEIYLCVPESVEKVQWKDFVDMALSEKFIEKSEKAKDYRKQQIETHIGGSKSFVRKRKELEKTMGGLVGEVDLYKATHQKPNGAANPKSAMVLEECQRCLDERRPLSEIDEIELQSQVIREVRGPEHPGRVRGQGLGPIPSKFFSTKSREKSSDLRRLEAEVELLKERDAEREAEREAEKAEQEKLRAEINSLRETLYLYVSQER